MNHNITLMIKGKAWLIPLIYTQTTLVTVNQDFEFSD